MDQDFRFFAHLFVKVPWPKDSKGTFRSSIQAATCYFLFNHSEVKASRLAPCPRTLAGLISTLLSP